MDTMSATSENTGEFEDPVSTPELYMFHPHIRWLKKTTGSFQQV
jgi:hypothetical protein